MIHYGKLHAVLTQGSPITVRIFQDRKEAAGWLGVPIERLAEEAERSRINSDHNKKKFQVQHLVARMIE